MWLAKSDHRALHHAYLPILTSLISFWPLQKGPFSPWGCPKAVMTIAVIDLSDSKVPILPPSVPCYIDFELCHMLCFGCRTIENGIQADTCSLGLTGSCCSSEPWDNHVNKHSRGWNNASRDKVSHLGTFILSVLYTKWLGINGATLHPPAPAKCQLAIEIGQDILEQKTIQLTLRIVRNNLCLSFIGVLLRSKS